MSYCKYHPASASINYCPHCDIHVCEVCTNEGDYGEDNQCLLCDKPMEHTGAPVDVTPFWRRIDQSFRYPLQKSVLAFIAILSFLGAAFSYLPGILTIGINLALTGALLKYCFSCLHETAMGNMQAADITSAYQGGVSLFFRLLFIFILALGAIAASFGFLGQTSGILVTVFFVLAFPAMIIMYAMSESIADTLNPVKIMQLIAGIGLPYGLILGIIVIMMGSVGLISEAIGYGDSIFILTLQSIISNYYAIVMFHILGYMIFQYQDRLGFTSQYSSEPRDARPEPDRELARLNILVKEGKWEQLPPLAEQALKKYRDNRELQNFYFRFTLNSLAGTIVISREFAKDPQENQSRVLRHVQGVFDNYLLHLIETGQQHLLRHCFLQIQAKLKGFRPVNPRVRFELAKTCNEAGSYKTTIALVNGLHKQHPDFIYLLSAYRLMLDALKALPAPEAQLLQCQKLIDSLEQKAQHKRLTSKSSFEPQASGEPESQAPENNESTDGEEQIEETNGDMPMIEFKL